MPQVPRSINAAGFLRADPYRAGVVALGLIWATLIQQGLPYWDADYENIFKPVLAKPLIGHVLDVLSPASADPQDWGFMDRPAQFAFYSFAHVVAGYNSWPYLLLRIFALATLGGAVYMWGQRMLPGRPGDRLAAAMAALFLVVAPGATAAMIWLGDFAPVTECLLAVLTYKIWSAIEETPHEWSSISPRNPEQRRWVLRWAILTAVTYIGYKTKANVKLLPGILGLYLLMTRRAQWKVFLLPVAAMLALAVPWSANLMKPPPFLPGAEGSATGWKWQPASLDRLQEYLWSNKPYDFRSSFTVSPISLAGLLGPFLLATIVLFAWWRFEQRVKIQVAVEERKPMRFRTPQERARLFAMLWLVVTLLGMSALPPIPDYFRTRYTIMPFVPACILLSWVFGLFIESTGWKLTKTGPRLPRWAVAGFVAMLALQFGVNVSRSLRYRRELGAIEIAVDKAYRYIDAKFPDANVAAMPDFLSYAWRPDAVSPLHRIYRVNDTPGLALLDKTGKTLALSWQGSLGEDTDLVELFPGCSAGTVFDHLMPCAPATGIFLMRYIGPDPLRTAANAARAANNLPVARTLYQKFLEQHPNNLGARFWLGYTEWYLKDWNAAERDNSFVENYLPDLQPVIYNRALSLAAIKQYGPAIGRLKRLTQMEPKNYGVLWNLYWAYRNDGDKTKALETIANMKTLFPADPEVNRLIADKF